MGEKHAVVLEAEERGAKAVARAYAVTDEKYHAYIMVDSRNTNVGSKNNPLWASIQFPYMRVPGRVAMIKDEAARLSVPLTIQSQPIFDAAIPHVRTTVTLGDRSATGHAEITTATKPGDEPLKIAETSAVGRALGFLGFGEFSGIASAEDMEAYFARNGEETTSSTPIPEGLAFGSKPQPVASTEQKPPSDRQLAFLRDLAEQLGLTEDDINGRLVQIITRDQASAAIEKLQALVAESKKKADDPHKAKRDAVTKLLAYAEENQLTDRLSELMDGTKLEQLTEATAQELHEKLRAENAERWAQADAKNEQAAWAAGDLAAQADQEAQDQEDFGFQGVPEGAQRKM